MHYINAYSGFPYNKNNSMQQDQDGTEFLPDPARQLSINLYDIYHC
jgi:hypothetical protein